MYAIVEIAGQQFKVEEGKKIFVHRLEAETGKEVEFDKVLLIEDDGKIIIGEPVIKDARVEGKILDQVRGDKVIVFKKKRKKGYRIKNGHRQNFTQVEIISIKEKADKKPVKKAEKKEETLVAEAVPEKTIAAETKAPVKKPASKKSAPEKVSKESTPVKKTVTKKSGTEKPAAKKPAAKKPAKGKA
jgi:large subunit ribosomal protein L21